MSSTGPGKMMVMNSNFKKNIIVLNSELKIDP